MAGFTNLALVNLTCVGDVFIPLLLPLNKCLTKEYELLELQGRSSTKVIGGAKVWKKCRPPWLADGENFIF